MNTTDYLNAVKAKYGAASDYKLAQLLEGSTAQISQYRTRKRVMDDYTAARVADLLGVEEMAVIAQANAEREKDADKRAFWTKKAADFVAKSAAIRVWRARDDSNVRPLPSEGSSRSPADACLPGRKSQLQALPDASGGLAAEQPGRPPRKNPQEI